MQVTIQMADPPVIPETEFCVLVGNLLENAVDACADTDAEIQSFIRLHVVQTGSSMLSITADNTSSGSPNWSGDKLLSTKHAGYGIGTESIRTVSYTHLDVYKRQALRDRCGRRASHGIRYLPDRLCAGGGKEEKVRD